MILHIVGRFLNKEKLELIMARNAAPPNLWCVIVWRHRGLPPGGKVKEIPPLNLTRTHRYFVWVHKNVIYMENIHFFLFLYLNAFMFENELPNWHDLLTRGVWGNVIPDFCNMQVFVWKESNVFWGLLFSLTISPVFHISWLPFYLVAIHEWLSI